LKCIDTHNLSTHEDVLSYDRLEFKIKMMENAIGYKWTRALLTLLISMSVLIAEESSAQNVSVNDNGAVPDNQALLDMNVNAPTGSNRRKGVLFPRMTTAERDGSTGVNATGSSDFGLIIFNTSTGLYNYWSGSAWVEMATTTSSTDHDWYEVGGTSPANTITDDIFTQGNVGIGAIDPDALLEVNGIGNILIKVVRNSSNLGDLSGIGLGVQGSSHIVKSGLIHERELTNGVGKLHFVVDNNTDANDVSLSESRMTIDRDGLVGIGTNAPQRKLHVDGNARIDAGGSKPIVFTSGNFGLGNTTDMLWNEGDVGFNQEEFAMYNANNNGAANRYFAMFYTADGDASGLNVRKGGNVGIGTTAPSAKLDVVGTMQLSATGTETAGNVLVTDASGNTTWTNPTTLGLDDHDWYEVGGTSAPDAINDNIFTQGSVGIGTTTPTGKLQVEGDEVRIGNAGTANYATADGDLYVEDALEVDGIAYVDDYVYVDSQNEIAMIFEDNGGTNSIYHTINDGNGNYNIMLGVDGNANYTATNDGASKILMSGHGSDGEISLNVGPQGTVGNTVAYTMGLSLDAADLKLRIGASDNVGLDGTAGNIIADVDGVLYTDRIRARSGTGLRITDDANNLGMFVEDGGDVGVGTATPTAKLDVVGTLQLDLTGTETAGNVLITDASGNASWSDQLPNDDAGYIWNQNVGNNFGTGQSASYDITGNAEIGGTLEVSGKVGIGTTAPTQLLTFGVVGGIKFANSEDNDIVSPAGGELFYDANYYSPTEAGDGHFNNDGGGLAIYDAADGWGALISTANMRFAELDLSSLHVGGTSDPGDNNAMVDGRLQMNSGDGDKIFLTNSLTGSRIAHSTGWQIDLKAGPGNSGTTGEVSIWTTEGNVYKEQVTVESDGDLEMRDNHFRSVRAIHGSDWDDDTGGSDDKYRLLYRDGAHMFYNGGVVVGNYGNGTWSDLSDGTLIVEGNTGMGTTNPTYKLHVNGRLKTTGINETSDARLKKDIEPIDRALDKVLEMDGVTYNWRVDEFPDQKLSDDRQHGLIAQELEKIIPELVLTDKEGWKSIEYTHLVPVLIEAIKEQHTVISDLKKTVAEQNYVVNSLKTEAGKTNMQIQQLWEQLNGYSSSVKKTDN